jgi:predicted ATPase/signal transduction histidine kinase
MEVAREIEIGGDAIEIAGEISRGRRYLVSRARRRRDGATLVVKTIPTGHPDTASLAARLRREHALLAALNLRGVVRAIGLDSGTDQPGLIMEDAGAQTLKEWLHRRSLAPDQFLPLAIQLAEALGRLHERRIIHRDVSSSNVVLGDDAHLTLVDFGAATRLPASGGVPPQLETVLPYISPEETGRTSRLVDHRTDLYSLGALFYEMLTGAPPFATTDPVELLHAHLARAPVPPTQIDPGVPVVLSDLVLKLLAKMPEARYQSAAALVEDLQEAHARLRRAGSIAPFDLGVADLARELPLPERLYQREGQRATLADAWARAACGERVLALLAGSAGAGKSALVADLRGEISSSDGLFLTGKGDLLRSGAPYAPLAEALQSLANTMVATPPAELAVLRQRLREAVGPAARVITDLCPALEPLVGAFPALPNLGTKELESRFQLALRAFVGAVASAARPVVLFFDDLQWVDSASLRAFVSLAGAPELHHLLLVGAYRSEELGPALEAQTLSPLRQISPGPVMIEFGALDVVGVTALCADALHCSADRAGPLAAVLVKKTAGNPFFVRRLLRFLHQRGLLAFLAGAWSWNLTSIEAVEVTENVVDLLVVALGRLPNEARDSLRVAACIGNAVPVDLLAAVRRMPIEQAAATLWTAVGEGLMEAVEGDGRSSAPIARFQFVHDRVREAADSLLDDGERQALHLEIGRRLLEGAPDRSFEERLFAIVDQLNAGAALITDPAERGQLAELNLRAARRAGGASAFGGALLYCQRGIALLPQDAWRARHELTFELHRRAMEGAYATGERGLADALFERTLANANSRAEKSTLYAGRVVACVADQDPAQAVRWGLEGLRANDIEMPAAADLPAATRAELAAVQANLRGRSVDELLQMPVMTGEDERARMLLLMLVGMPVYMTRPDLFPFVVARTVNQSLRDGNTAHSASAYLSYAVLFARLTGDYVTAHCYGRLGVELARRFGDPVQECRTLSTCASAVNPWLAPLASSVAMAREAQQRGLEGGELLYGVAAAVTAVTLLYHQGTELGRVLAEIEAASALAQRTNTNTELPQLLAHRLAIRRLQGLTQQRGCVESADVASGAEGRSVPECRHQILRLGVAYLLGELEEARRLSAEAAPRLASVPRFTWLVEHNYYTSLTLTASYGQASAAEREQYRAVITENQRLLGIWAANAPQNYRPKHLLVSAELARIEGRALEAAELYDEAIEAAEREQFLQDEALANELAGRFHRDEGRRRFARSYLGAAVDGYLRWGAKAKADLIEAEFPMLGRKAGGLVSRGSSQDDSAGAALDLVALFQAAEAISGEVVLSQLLGKLLEVCLAIAGAERGALVLEEDGAVFVRASGSIGAPTSLERTLIARSPKVPTQVIEEVRTTGEALVLPDAARHPRFAADPYIAARAVRSALVLPILRQAKLVGTLYLENNLASRVFTPERVRLLQLLSSQIATSLENSRLFEKLTLEIDERKRAEAAVRFLADSGAALAESLDYRATLTRVARLAVSFLADWCVVDALEDGELHPVAAAHRDPEKETLLHDFRRLQDIQGPPRTGGVLASGRPGVTSEVTDAVVAELAPDPEGQRRLRAIGIQSTMTLPLQVADRSLGVITFVSADPARRYGPNEVALASELARRAAMAIDNARLYRESQEAISLRDEFLSIASHELNTPIAALLLRIEGLQSEMAAGAPLDLSRSLQVMLRQTQRLSGLVAEILDVALVQGKRLQLHLERADLAAIVREVVERFSEELARSKSPLTVVVDPTVLGRWDRARLEQVVTSLLENAIKFARGRPITITATTVGGRARLIVKDEGMGIAAERLPHIFARLERGVPATQYGGLGLGLYLVREIVHALGGTVSVESVLGAGATFTVELPAENPATDGNTPGPSPRA